MSLYPEKELELKGLLKLSFLQHWATLKYAFICIIFMTLIKYAGIVAQHVFLNHDAVVAVDAVFFLLMGFFFSTAIFAAHRSFTATLPVNDALKAIWRQLPRIIGTLCAYILGIFILYYAMHYLVIAIHHFDHHKDPMAQNIARVLGFVIIMVFVCMFFFSYPLSVIDEKSIQDNFYNSAMLSEKNKMGIFILFFIISTTFSVLLASVRIEWLAIYHLNIIYDFLALCIFLPFFINFLLLLINDSKQQILTE